MVMTLKSLGATSVMGASSVIENAGVSNTAKTGMGIGNDGLIADGEITCDENMELRQSNASRLNKPRTIVVLFVGNNLKNLCT